MAIKRSKKFSNRMVATSLGIAAFFLLVGVSYSFSVAPVTNHKTNTAASNDFRLRLFGGILGGSRKSGSDINELAFFPKVASSSLKFESLYRYIQEWSQLLENDRKGMGLTTPVKVFLSSPAKPSEDDNVVELQSSVRIVFKPTQTGDSYKSKKEEKAEANGNDDKKKKRKKMLEGGVEVLVQQLEDGGVQVLARRCDFDEDTVIKEMSEETIVQELKKAITSWKKQQQA